MSRLACYLAVAVASLGALVFSGWLLGDIRVATILPGSVPMQPMTAVCFMVCAAAICAQAGGRWAFSMLTSLGVLLVAAVTGAQYAFDVQTGLDDLLLPGRLAELQQDYPYPGRMAPGSTLGFALASSGLLVRGFAQGTRRALVALTTAGMGACLALSMVSLLGYLFQVGKLQGAISSTQMALPTAVAMAGVSLAGLLLPPHGYWLRLLLSESLGGLAVRRMLPVVVGLPIVLSWLALMGTRHQLYSTEVRLVLMAFGSVALLVGLTLWAARELTSTVERYGAEQEKLIADLRRAEADAQAATRAKSQFVANMSHELRTPLTSVIGFSELLTAQPELTPASRRFLARIENAGKALLATVNDVLDFSKLEADEVEFRVSPISPQVAITEVVELFTLQAADRSLILRAQGLADLPMVVSLDGERLRQVLLNLIGNAVKFTEHGSVTVRCEHDARSERLSVFVADTGPGLQPQEMEQLFKRFSQIDGPANRHHGGTGLGLAICKALVQGMGGEIGVASTPGQGSTFWFHLPAPVAEGGSVPVQNSTRGLAISGTRVLVVDDHPSNRDVVVGLLCPRGVEVTEVSSGEEAVAAAQVAPFDVILMDLRMQGISGAEAARMIRQGGGPNDMTPILAFSSGHPADDEAHLFDGAVRKPVTSDTLAAAVAAAISDGSPMEARHVA